MNTLLIVSFILGLFSRVFITFSVKANNPYCYSTDQKRPQVKHFSSRTAYQFVKGTTFNKDSVIPNCKPVKFWMLGRHGTRLPDRKQIAALPKLESLRDDIKANYENKIESGLCAEDLQLILNWTLDTNITEKYQNYLTTQGWDDLKILGQDYKEAFPNLFHHYNENNFLFRSTDSQRTIASFKAFVEGLFAEKAYEYVKRLKPHKIDKLLVPYSNCPLWVERARAKNGYNTEFTKFRNSESMTKTIKSVSNRLGFKTRLSFKQVNQLWDICRFETAWFLDKPSAWCTAFTMEDILVFEYYEDLKREFFSGYSTQVSETVPCYAVKDLMTHLNSEGGPQVVAYFSHSTLIQLFATAMGIQKDDSLLTSEGFKMAGNRKWRTSEIDAFAANFVVIKYDCSRDPSPRIGFFSSQRPIDMVGCRDGFCKLEDFNRKYAKQLNADCSSDFCTSSPIARNG